MTKTPNQDPNPSIGCSVNSCAYHCGKSQHCTLNEIMVGGCGTTPKRVDETMCASFEDRSVT